MNGRWYFYRLLDRLAQRVFEPSVIIVNEQELPPQYEGENYPSQEQFPSQPQQLPAPYVSQPPVNSAPTETKIVRNLFQGVQVRLHVGTTVLEFASGEERTVDLPQGSIPWAEALLPNQATGRLQWTAIGNGAGMYALPNGAGWEFQHPEDRPTIR